MHERKLCVLILCLIRTQVKVLYIKVLCVSSQAAVSNKLSRFKATRLHTASGKFAYDTNL